MWLKYAHTLQVLFCYCGAANSRLAYTVTEISSGLKFVIRIIWIHNLRKYRSSKWNYPYLFFVETSYRCFRIKFNFADLIKSHCVVQHSCCLVCGFWQLIKHSNIVWFGFKTCYKSCLLPYNPRLLMAISSFTLRLFFSEGFYRRTRKFEEIWKNGPRSLDLFLFYLKKLNYENKN